MGQLWVTVVVPIVCDSELQADATTQRIGCHMRVTAVVLRLMRSFFVQSVMCDAVSECQTGGSQPHQHSSH